jgi:asparagine synthase (glutamine-hydrolysing)
MSGIAGIYNLDNKPADPALLRRMIDRMAHRGPDGRGYWIEGPVGLGHAMLQTTPESLQEKQPLLSHERGSLCLTLDGRVDNRSDVRAALESKGLMFRTDTDAELLLRAYECWGEDCPQHILGDFAFAVWDGRNRKLFCARDILGIKPFYYSISRRRFLWASELRPLLEDPSVRKEPNEGMIGEYLANALTSNEETLFLDIQRLPPAHYVGIRNGQLFKGRYWDIDPGREIRYQTDEDYAQHFLAIFREAVRCRLRSQHPVAADLSGGLDSSSVVSMAQSLFHDGLAVDRGFGTFSAVFPGRACDESDYIQDVITRWGLRSHHVAAMEPDVDISVYAEQVARDYDFPNYPNCAISAPLRVLAKERGCRVILNGVGGDEWLTGSIYHSADLVRRMRLLTLARQFRDDSRVPGMIWPSWAVLRLGIWPLLPQTLRLAIRRFVRRDGRPSWITPSFASRIHLTDRLHIEAGRRRHASFAQEDLCRALTNGWQSHGNEVSERLSARLELEERSPLVDRRVIEFALALPETQRWRHDQPKFILRQAMRGLLPESIRQRRTKAEFSHTFADTLQAYGRTQFFDSLVTERLGWVDGEEVRALHRRLTELYAQGDERYVRYTWPLWMIVGIELWFAFVMGEREGSTYAAEQQTDTGEDTRRQEALHHTTVGGLR